MKQAFGTKKNRAKLLKRMWQYMGRNRLMIVLAVLLSAASSLLSLYGPKLSGQAINAITDPNGVNFRVVLTCAAWMA